MADQAERPSSYSPSEPAPMLSASEKQHSRPSVSGKRSVRKGLEYLVAPVANRVLAAGERLQENVLNPVQENVLNPVQENLQGNVLPTIAATANEIIARKDKSVAIAPRWLRGEQDPFLTAMTPRGFYRRFFFGAALRYIYGIGLQLQVVDTFLNTLSLINALFVTIPFGVMSMYSFDYWESLQSNMEANGCGASFNKVYREMRDNLNAVLCFSLIPLLVTTLYYIVRPTSFGEVPEDETLVKISNSGKLIYQEEDDDVDIDNQTDPTILQRIQVALQLDALRDNGTDLTHEERTRAIITSIVLDARNEQRKDRQNFYYWWQRARLAIFIAFFTTMGSVYALFSLAAQIMTYYSAQAHLVCNGVGMVSGYYLGVSFAFLIIALYVLL